MVVDTSALIAILEDEAAARRLVLAMHAAPTARISAASVAEAGIVVLRRRGERGERELDALVNELSVEVVAVTADHARLARTAYRRFGKGRHPAGLNFGDCFAYALARALDEPLLFVGDDFSRTDVQVWPY